MNPQLITPEDIYKKALASLGIDASPNDEAPDELGCAETVSDILCAAGCIMPTFLSTQKFNHFLFSSPDWIVVLIPKRGDVVMSYTGAPGSGRGGITHGHCGIVMDGDLIASNNSVTGKFLQNYTLAQWKQRWATQGGYPMVFYRKKFIVPTPVEAPVPVPIVPPVVPVEIPATPPPPVSLSAWQLIVAFCKAFGQFLQNYL